MRIKLFSIIACFLALCLFLAGVVLYFYFKSSLIQNAEMRLIHYADAIELNIVKDPTCLKTHAQQLLITNSTNEFNQSVLFGQLQDCCSGNVIAKTHNLNNQALPFNKNEYDKLYEFEFEDGVKLMTYQTRITIENVDICDLIVGVPITHLYKTFSKLQSILVITLLFTLIVLGIGLSTLIMINIIQNQKNFLSFASHELRTPLAVIQGQADVTLKYKSSKQDYLDALNTIREEAHHMKRIINNHLFVFRQANVTEKLTFSQFHFKDILVEAIEKLKEQHPKKTITLELYSDTVIQGDIDRLNQVVTNLLENAAANTAPDGIIKIRLQKSKKHMEFQISDNGKGIEKKYIRHIFKPFYRIDNNAYTGSGLGLTIVKWIVKKHKGHIVVNSTIGKGTIFTIQLPI